MAKAAKSDVSTVNTFFMDVVSLQEYEGRAVFSASPCAEPGELRAAGGRSS